jgi:ParB family chromosome partitioning protein
MLSLPEKILESLSKGAITEGHAKVILSLEEESQKLTLWQVIVKDSLSVRETERRAASLKGIIPRGITEKPKSVPPLDEIERARLQQELSLALGAKVNLRYTGPQSGQIELQFYSLDQFDGLYRRLARKLATDE